MFTKLASLGINKLLSSLGVVAMLSTTAVTSVMVYQKVTQDPQPVEIQSVQAAKDEMVQDNQKQQMDIQLASKELFTADEAGLEELNSEQKSAVAPESQLVNPALSADPNVQSLVATDSFTAETLALYDGRSGQCYIALNGLVYNVSYHPSWQDCTHHGIKGGQDITTIFPHPTSYLSGLTLVGTYTGSAGQQVVNPEDREDDEYEEDDEDESDERDDDNEEEDDKHNEDEAYDLEDQYQLLADD